MRKLPKIYQNNFNKKIMNNREVCYLKNEDNIKEKQDIQEILIEIFSGIGYSYNIPVLIKTSNKVYETSLIAKTRNNVVTLDNEIIPINKIISIEKL